VFCLFQIFDARFEVRHTGVDASQDDLVFEDNLRHGLAAGYTHGFALAGDAGHHVNTVGAQHIDQFEAQLRHTGGFDDHIDLAQLLIEVPNFGAAGVDVRSVKCLKQAWPSGAFVNNIDADDFGPAETESNDGE